MSCAFNQRIFPDTATVAYSNKVINLITCRLVELWTIMYKLIYTDLSESISDICES